MLDMCLVNAAISIYHKINIICTGDFCFINVYHIIYTPPPSFIFPTETLHQRPETVWKEFLPHPERLSAQQKDCNLTPSFLCTEQLVMHALIHGCYSFD